MVRSSVFGAAVAIAERLHGRHVVRINLKRRGVCRQRLVDLAQPAPASTLSSSGWEPGIILAGPLELVQPRTSRRAEDQITPRSYVRWSMKMRLKSAPLSNCFALQTDQYP